MITMEPARTKEDFAALAGLAKEVWRQHYHPIIGEDQVAYMIEKYQSPSAIEEQVSHGYTYYFLRSSGQNAGYMAILPEQASLFLSKLYVKEAYRGQKIASQAIAFLKEFCRDRHLATIWLTVNRYNAGSIAVYQHLGFTITREQKADIGHGYFMDDYIMELTV